MIVPKFRLIFWTGIVFLPFSILAATGPLAAWLYGGLVTVWLVIAFVDAILAFRRPNGISIELPEVVRFSKGREEKILLRINNQRMKVRHLRLGLAFPIEIYSPNQDLTAELPKDSPSSTLAWPCAAIKQGNFVLSHCYLEVASLLDLWGVRGKAPAHTEIRVYPNLFTERKNLASLFLNQRLGIHVQRQMGKGRDFDQLREYMAGDSFEDIHWKATAKRGYPITKVYQIERMQQVYLIMDASRLSARRSDRNPHDRFKDEDKNISHVSTILDRFVTAGLIMGLAAERQGDLFGILTFSDRVQGFIKAKSGKPHYRACREILHTLQPQSVSPDFSELFTFIGMQIRQRSLLIFLINLDDPVLVESFIQNIDLVSKRHLILVAMLKPFAARPLFSSSSIESVNDLYGDLGAHFLWESLCETEKVLQRRGIGLALLDNEKMSAQLVSQYINIKQRQVL